MAGNPSPISSSELAEQYLIDELFGAIQAGTLDGVHRMREILRDDPKLANMRSDPDKMHIEMSGQDLLDNQKLGYLLTQDVLRYRQGEDVKIQYKFSQKPLHFACLLGNLDAVRLLLEQPNIDLNAKNGSKETPLGVACRAAQLPIATLLLVKSSTMTDPSRKIHVDQQDDASNTPMEYLVCEGIYPVWTDVQTDEELATLARSIISASEQVSKTSSGDFKEACMKIASQLQSSWLLEVVLDLAKYTKDIEVDNERWRPIHFAIARGDTRAVEMLLKAEADTTKRGFEVDAAEFAIQYWEPDISDMIKAFNLSRDVLPDKLKGQITSEKKTKGATGFKELPVRELIGEFGEAKDRAARDPKKIIWCHLPANDWSWVKALYEKTTMSEHDNAMLEHINEALKNTRESSPSGHSLITQSSKGPGADPTPGSSAVLMLPVIDIDLLDGFKKQKTNEAKNPALNEEVMKLYNSSRKRGLEPPLTLDHHHHNDLDENGLRILNDNQVFTRYIKNHEKTTEKTKGGEKVSKQNNDPAPISEQQVDSYGHSSWLENQCLKIRQPGLKDRFNDRENSKIMNSQKRILVVSQLWIFRTSNILITLFPQRRGAIPADQQQQAPERRSHEQKPEDLQAQDLQLQEGQLRKQELQEPPLLQTLKRLFRDSEHPDVVYHDMVKDSIGYQSAIKIDGEPNSYLDVFSKEILRISLGVDQCYEIFKQCLGSSDKHFKDLSKNATEFLMDIRDVLNELEIIKEISNQKLRVWKDLHKKVPPGRRDLQTSDATQSKRCSWGIENCNSSTVHGLSYGYLGKLKKSAETVDKKAFDLVSLLQGQAGTENALRSSEQARYLAIFTWLTVFFSPLSFVMSLLALQIDSFTPVSWTAGEVAIACVVSVVTTFVICALPLSWMKYGYHILGLLKKTYKDQGLHGGSKSGRKLAPA